MVRQNSVAWSDLKLLDRVFFLLLLEGLSQGFKFGFQTNLSGQKSHDLESREFLLLLTFWESVFVFFFSLELFLLPVLWQSLQRGTHSSLSSLPPLEPGVDSVGQPGWKLIFLKSFRFEALRPPDQTGRPWPPLCEAFSPRILAQFRCRSSSPCNNPFSHILVRPIILNWMPLVF